MHSKSGVKSGMLGNNLPGIDNSPLVLFCCIGSRLEIDPSQ